MMSMEEAQGMKRRTFGAALVLLATLSVAGWALQYPVTVSNIEIEGTVEIKDRDVLDVIGFEVGDDVSESDLRAASQAVFDLGWFSEVAPEVGENGEITFHVVENPVIREIVITGNTYRKWYSVFGVRLFRLPIVSTSKIRQILREGDIKKRSVLNRASLETALSDVITEYNDRGYVLVALGDVELGETLRIEIIEARVAANTISGLVTIPARVAEELIDVPLGEPVRMVDVQRVLSRLGQSVYFTNVEVVPQPGPEPDSVVLQWNLEERDLIREPIRLEGIVLQGISCHAEDTVYAELGEIPAEPIDNYGLLMILEGAYDLYSDAGYMMVRLAVEGIEDGALHVRVEEGRVSEIVLEGIDHTKDYVIFRRLDIEVGEILNRADYLSSHQSLTSLGYFQSVDIAPEWVEDGVRVNVTVNEKARLGGFEGSMALDPSTGGIVGELKLREKNLFGTGQDVSLSFSRGLVGEEEPRAVTWDLAYTSVAFFPEFDRVGLDLYRTTKEITEGEEASSITTYGVRTSFAYPVADYVDLGLTYKHEEERIAGQTSWTPTDSVTMSMTYDDVNDAYFPTGGTRRSVSVEKAGGFSAGREYFNLRLDWIQFTAAELPWFGSMRQALGVRFKVGWGDNQLPASQYYELGGSASVRGMDSSSVPRMFVANVEHRVELAEDGLYMTTFFDTGLDLDAVRLDAILSTGGIEFGVNAAGIFVRLDVGWSLSSEWSWVPRFDIGFGRMF
jgi:outer membrane protein insertion porin family